MGGPASIDEEEHQECNNFGRAPASFSRFDPTSSLLSLSLSLSPSLSLSLSLPHGEQVPAATQPPTPSPDSEVRAQPVAGTKRARALLLASNAEPLRRSSRLALSAVGALSYHTNDANDGDRESSRYSRTRRSRHSGERGPDEEEEGDEAEEEDEDEEDTFAHKLPSRRRETNVAPLSSKRQRARLDAFELGQPVPFTSNSVCGGRVAEEKRRR